MAESLPVIQSELGTRMTPPPQEATPPVQAFQNKTKPVCYSTDKSK